MLVDIDHQLVASQADKDGVILGVQKSLLSTPEKLCANPQTVQDGGYPLENPSVSAPVCQAQVCSL